ncbi:anti-sigma F factor antagonist [Pelosinus sp. sgz500959]|uniref:anti-sigma F factor antagonist n=1 Tax=Pelosinus sp. sgz500959 TaxID=3242472 RepID=UPI00367348AD
MTTFLKRGVLIVRVDGELDMHVADEFRQRVDHALSTSGVKNILFNFGTVHFIDSSGIGVILGRYKKICILGGKVLVTNVQPQVLKIFELSGLLKIITLHHSEAEALECL